ncbi:MAG: helix-turn-helix transcriptional regulator [Candidatus Aquicultor sp.]
MTLGDVLTQYPSSLITVGTAFAFLWLALYVFRVNPEDSVSKLASGAMVTVFFYLFSTFMVGTASSKTQLILYQKSLWWLPFAPVLWLHLSQKATQPLRVDGAIGRSLGTVLNAIRSSAMTGAFYGIAVLFLLAGAFTDSLFKFSALNNADLPLKYHSIPTGPGYILFTAFIFLMISIALVNFLIAWWQDRKHPQFLWLSLGSLLFWIASTGLLITSITGASAGFITGNRIMAIGIIIVAIAILKYNALLKREALQKDAIYVSIGALAITLVYAGAVFIGEGSILDVPAAIVVLVAALALSTHMLADALRIWFSRFIGTRLGLFTETEVDKMKHFYIEASKVTRLQEPAIDLFDDGDESVDRLLELLTPRQREIITLRAKGLSDKQIADTLDIKLPTVRKHVEDIKTRIGSRDKADCAIYCVVTGLLTKDDLLDWFGSLDINGNGNQ